VKGGAEMRGRKGKALYMGFEFALNNSAIVFVSFNHEENLRGYESIART
jgi:hypothetical protein